MTAKRRKKLTAGQCACIALAWSAPFSFVGRTLAVARGLLARGLLENAGDERTFRATREGMLAHHDAFR